MTPPTPRTVFCDFDGTVTVDETFVRVMRMFTPELAEALIPPMVRRELSLEEGVRRMIESIPSARYEEMLAQGRDEPIRDGFGALLDDLHQLETPFVLVSGGLMGLITTVLGAQLARMAGVYAIEVRTEGSHLQVVPGLEGDGDLVSKVAVMARHPAQERVVIGDSVTDFKMAQEAELVFARDRLAEFLASQGRDFEPWETFHDVRRVLKARWGHG